MNNHIGVTRRQALQRVFWALSAGLLIDGRSHLVAGEPEQRLSERPIKEGLFFNKSEMDLLSEMVEIIIPTNDTPGAREANVHGFLDQLMAEWALPETQKEFRELLGEINERARMQFGQQFMGISYEKRVKLITEADTAAFAADTKENQGNMSSSISPFARFKALTLLGYYHSEIGATQELQFQLVPGHYDPCVPLSDIGRSCVGELYELLAYQQMETP